jgi:regulator of chromosome condensation
VRRVTKLAAGAQHVLALTSNGAVFTWGSEEQGQLGRRFQLSRHSASPLSTLPWLIPGPCAVRDIIDVGAGLYHSFAIRKNGKVYAWGSNNFGQTGIFKSAGQSDAAVPYPTEVSSFGKEVKINTVFGGKDHSLALTDQGQCLTWGRIDNKALGLVTAKIPSSNIIYDTYGKPRILKIPTRITIQDVAFITAGTDHSFAITKDGKGYSWGFNAQHQTGHMTEDDDEIEEPTLLDNKHVTGKLLVSAAAGGQFSIVAGQSESQVNGNP